MRQYRIYHLDGDGHVSSAEWLDAAGDEAAIRAARRNNRVKCELWQGRRLVTKLGNRTAKICKSASPSEARVTAIA